MELVLVGVLALAVGVVAGVLARKTLVSTRVRDAEARAARVMADAEREAETKVREALLEVKENGPRRRLFGVKLRDKGVPRQGYEVLSEGRSIGTVASGNFSPTLGTGIALAFGAADDMPAQGAIVEIEARGRRMRGDIVKPPFIERRKKAT